MKQTSITALLLTLMVWTAGCMRKADDSASRAPLQPATPNTHVDESSRQTAGAAQESASEAIGAAAASDTSGTERSRLSTPSYKRGHDSAEFQAETRLAPAHQYSGGAAGTRGEAGAPATHEARTKGE